MPIMALLTTPTDSTTPGGIISGGIPGGTIAGSIRLQESSLIYPSDQDVQIMYKWINRYLFIPIYGYKNMERTLTTAEKTSQLVVRINGTRDLAS
jgi:hypothetical protein